MRAQGKQSRISVTIFALCLTAGTNAQENGNPNQMDAEERTVLRQNINQRLQKHYVRSRGAEQPTSISFAGRMGIFFSSVPVHKGAQAYAESLRTKVHLSADDAGALASAVFAAPSAPAEIDDIGVRTRQLHAELGNVTNPGEAVDIGRKLNAIAVESDAAWTAHYETILLCLSVDGRRTLDEYVAREIVPQMTQLRIDYAALYADAETLLPQMAALQAAESATESHEVDSERSLDHGEGSQTNKDANTTGRDDAETD
jgi:hypothetical protein